jgi:hypothetical protein
VNHRTSQPALHYAVIFEYVGLTSLTAAGPVTGKRYRFEAKGTRVAVDPRDRRAMAGVPHLRQVIA